MTGPAINGGSGRLSAQRDRMLEDGPAEYWSREKQPTPAQYRAVTLAACRLLGVPGPESRLDATVLLARLRLAAAAPPGGLPDVPELAEDDIPL